MNISLPPPVQNPYANSNADHTEPTPTQRTTLHLGRHRSPHQPESRTRLGRSLLERAMRHYYCFLKMCGLGRKQYHGKHRHRRDACRCVKVKDRLLSRVGAAACTIGGGRVSKRSRHAIICGHELWRIRTIVDNAISSTSDDGTVMVVTSGRSYSRLDSGFQYLQWHYNHDESEQRPRTRSSQNYSLLHATVTFDAGSQGAYGLIVAHNLVGEIGIQAFADSFDGSVPCVIG